MSAQFSEDIGLRKALGRYLDVVDGKEIAQFALCRSIAAEHREDVNSMWDEHSERLKELGWMKKQAKEQGLQWADLKAPDYSLLDLKIDIAEQLVKSCIFCEWKCHVDRTKGQLGFCRVGYKSHIACAFSHMGEEPEFIPSGTIFFSGCNSRCVFCLDGGAVIPLFDEGLRLVPISDMDVYFPKEGATLVERNFHIATPAGIKKIIGVQRRPVKDEKLLRIVTKRGKAITITGKHRIMVYDKKNNVIGKTAEEIKVGDKLIMSLKSMRLDLPKPQDSPRINLISQLSERVPKELLANVNVRNAFDFLRQLAKLKGIGGKRVCTKMLESAGVKSKKRNAPVSVIDFSKICKTFDPPEDLFYDVKIGVAGSEWTAPAILEVKPEFMWLLGYFVAEGHYTMRKNKGYGHLGITTKDNLDEIVRLINLAMRTWLCKSFVRNKTLQLYFGGKLWCLIFRYVFGIPPKAENKRFPDIVFNVNGRLQKAFLSGFLTGDGTVAYAPKISKCSIRFVTTSEVIKSQLSFLLHEKEIEFTVKEHFCSSLLPTGHRSKKKQWWITISGWYNIKKFHDIAEFFDARQKKIDTFLAVSRPRVNKCRIRNFERVKEIRLVEPSNEFVYDLSLEGKFKMDHTFFAGDGILVHNCQNWDISQTSTAGEVWDPVRIATWLNSKFRTRAIINANLVGGEPTPNLHNILKTMKGLDVNIPIIWNSNMYMSEEGMDLLHGIVDVYLADFKYGKDGCAQRLSSLKDYTRVVKRNHLAAARHAEMLIRHLVMPNHTECCAKPILDWIKENLGDSVRVNIMSQYTPYYRAYEFPEINRRIMKTEYAAVLEHAKKIGLTNIELQPLW